MNTQLYRIKDYLDDILLPIKHFVTRLVDEEVLIVGFELSIVLKFLGLDQSISYFVMILILADLLTKWYSLVVRHYGSYSFKNFFKAVHSGVINSHSLRRGVFGKIFMYAILIFIATELQIQDIADKVVFSDWLSEFIYTILVVSEILSILENFRDCGHSIASTILSKISRKTTAWLDDDDNDDKSQEAK